MEIFNFCFTFTIPAFKKIWYSGRKRAYASLSRDLQYKFLEDCMARSTMSDDKILYVYECHEDGRLHIHGMVFKTSFDYVALIRDKFYSHHSIGLAVSKYVKISDIQQTYYDSRFFIDYMNKNQDKIEFYQGNLQQIKNCNDLDGKSTKFDDMLIKSVDDKYYNDMVNFISYNYPDKYLHPYTKIERRKFLIDI